MVRTSNKKPLRMEEGSPRSLGGENDSRYLTQNRALMKGRYLAHEGLDSTIFSKIPMESEEIVRMIQETDRDP